MSTGAAPMPAGHVPPAVAGLVTRLIRIVRPDRIVMFGSYASGRATTRSDIDLLVVVADEETAQELSRRRAQLTGGIVPRVDLVSATREELLTARGERAAFLRGVLENGIHLHRVR